VKAGADVSEELIVSKFRAEHGDSKHLPNKNGEETRGVT
jgi:hypothetical protein